MPVGALSLPCEKGLSDSIQLLAWRLPVIRSPINQASLLEPFLSVNNLDTFRIGRTNSVTFNLACTLSLAFALRLSRFRLQRRRLFSVIHRGNHAGFLDSQTTSCEAASEFTLATTVFSSPTSRGFPRFSPSIEISRIWDHFYYHRHLFTADKDEC